MEKNINIIPRKEILQYEVRTNRLAKYIGNKYLQNLIGWWIARKVTRKYNRYLISMDELQDINNDKYK